MIAIAPTFRWLASRLARNRQEAKAALDGIETSALAESLSRLRYDPPTFNLWQMLKTAVIGVPLLLLALWIGKWWLRESILREFRAEAIKKEQVQLAKDRAAAEKLQAEIDDVRQENQLVIAVHAEELAESSKRIAALQANLKQCGWAPGTAALVNGQRIKRKQTNKAAISRSVK